MKKPKKPKSKPNAPRKPSEPIKILTRQVEVADPNDFERSTLLDFVQSAMGSDDFNHEAASKLYFEEVDVSDYYDNHYIYRVKLFKNEEIEDPFYKANLAKYEKKLATYERKLKEYKEKLKAWKGEDKKYKEEMKAWKEFQERKQLEELKKKYES